MHSLFVLLFLAAFVQVFFKAFQQHNVIKYKWLLVPIVSYMMAAAEVVIISTIALQSVKNGDNWQTLFAVLSLGTGGWMGAYIAMYLHLRMEQ